MSVFKIILLCIALTVTGETARILAVFPMASVSHQVVFRPVTQELAKRGHEVVVITTDPAFPKGQAPANLTEIDTHDVSYKIMRSMFTNSASKGRKSDLVNQMVILQRVTIEYVEEILKNEEVKNMINDKNKKFDLIIIEACAKPAFIFSHIYKAPIVQFSSLGALGTTYKTFGAPEHPLVYPISINLRLNNLSRWEKILELYNYYQLMQTIKHHEREIDEMFQKKYGNEIQSIAELQKKTDMIFLNIHPIFEGIRPVPPSVKYVPGLHQNPHKDLPKDLKDYLDSSKNGVIYFSLGTNVDPTLLTVGTIQLFVKVFSSLPYDVLWKWTGGDLPGYPSNIRTSKWLPQSDLLRHPKIKAFLMQGGLQSIDEAITAGVPLVGIPMLGDQWFNVERFVHHKIGVGLDFETMTEEDLRKALLNVIEDKSYRENAIKLRALMSDKPRSSLETSMWWLEYIIRHGGAKHLRSPSADLSWAQYLELDIVLILFVSFVIALTLGTWTLCFVLRRLKSHMSQFVKVKIT